MLLYDTHTHRLLAEDRATDLRRTMGAPRVEEAGLTRAIVALRARLADRHEPDCYRDRPAAAGLSR